jgi:predicted Zn-dependent peptidase
MIVNLKNETDLSGLYFIYKGSTNLEKHGIYGISHFMEHLMCKNFDDMQDILQENSISWNAYTSNNEIVFYFTGLEECLSTFRDTLIDRMYQFNVTEEEVEKEKKIVLEEHDDIFTNQYDSFLENFNRLIFNNYNPIGLRSDIESFNLKKCEDFYDIQYKYPDKIVNISKTFELNRTDLKFEKRDVLKYIPSNQEPIIHKPNSFDGKTSINIFSLYNNLSLYEISILNFIASMLGSGLNSPLYQEVREKRGLVYFIHSYINTVGDTTSFNISTMSSDENIDTIISSINEVILNPTDYLTETLFNRFLKSEKIRKNIKLINRHSNISDIISEKVENYNKLLDVLTFEDVLVVYNKYITDTTFNVLSDKQIYNKEEVAI